MVANAFKLDGEHKEARLAFEKSRFDHRPILVMAFKNHSLDEMLIDIQKALPDAAVTRVGFNKDKRDEIEGMLLQNKARSQRRPAKLA